MSAEVDVYTPRPQATLPAKIQYAKALAESGLLPRDYRRQPANVLYAVEYGDMIGIPPMAAITGIHVIEGKPSASAGLISGLVRRAGHKLRVGYDSSKMMGWATIIRSDDADHEFRSEWDLERAVTAELCTARDGKPYAVDKNGKSLPWRKFYPSMVKARAITEVARDACEEILFGLHYTPDELGAEVDEEGNLVGELVPGDAPADQAPASPDPGGEAWVVHADPEEEAWAAEVAEMSGFADEDDGRRLWAEVVARRKEGQITPGEDKRLKGLIKTRWAELKVEADGEPVDGVIVDDLDPADPWALRIGEITDEDGAAGVTEEVMRELAAGHMDDDKAAAVHAAVAARVATFDGQGALV
jgi:hypothetical protein